MAEDLESLSVKLRGWFKEDRELCTKWHAQAREDYAFYHGHQWSDEDKAALLEKRRPLMSFNKVAPLVNAIIGCERNNKRQVRFIPRQIGLAAPSEILSQAAEWFRDESDAQFEDSEAFADAVIAGMGWIETRIDFENSAEGKPHITRLDPLKMFWDSTACKQNLADAQRLWYVEEKSIEEAKRLFPEVLASDLHAAWVNGAEDETRQNAEDFALRKTVTLVECRWYEYEDFYKLQHALSGKSYEISAAEAEQFKNNPYFKAAKLRRKIAKRAFLGRKLLAAPDRPLVSQGSLGWECITGYFDHRARLYYGVVRTMKDPQRWANKFFSQVMYLLNSQSKGGILAERGAFDDDRQAEESLSRTDQITWLKNGALSGTAPRLQPKPFAQFPNGFFTLFNECKEAITQVTGLSEEFVGTRALNQPGILEAQRRQSSLNLLAKLFDNVQLYRKRQGRLILHLLQNYLSDGRLIRIVGQEAQQYLPLTKEILAAKDYDIIVDEAPTSPNEKERSFAIIQQLLPQLTPYMTPQMGLELLRYSPLPASLVDKLGAMVAQQQQNQAQQDQQPNPEQQMLQLKMQKTQADLMATQQKAQAEAQKAQMALQTEVQKAQIDMHKNAVEAAVQEHRLAAEQQRNEIAQQNAALQQLKFFS